jgi:hypothetical protein
MLRAKSIHELRQEVKANDKFFAAGKPEAEAVARIVETYQTTEDCARAFVAWLKGGTTEDASKGSKPPGSVLETWHRQGDLEEGKEKLLSDDESAKARKPRRRK